MSETTGTVQYPLPEGVYDSFTYGCKCGATVTVVGGVAHPHDHEATK